MKSYKVDGKFTMTLLGGSIRAVGDNGTEYKFTREQASRILKKAHRDKTISLSKEAKHG
jgi:hypothetical protein